MKKIALIAALTVIMIATVSCKKNDGPSPYSRIILNNVLQDKSVSDVSFVLLDPESSEYEKVFAVIYKGTELTREKYIEAQFDIDVTAGEYNGATLIMVIARPDYCAKLFVIYQGEVVSHSVEIRAEHNPSTFFTPYIFYAPGQLRLSDSGNPRTDPQIVIPVKF